MEPSVCLLNLIENQDFGNYMKNIHLHIKELFLTCYRQITDPSEQSLIYIDYVLAYLHDHLNIGTWSEVAEHKREAFTIASFVKAVILVKLNASETQIKEAIKVIDKGFLLGLPIKSNPCLLTKSASVLSEYLNNHFEQKDYGGPQNSHKRPKLDYINDFCINVDILKCPSLEDFLKNYFLKEKPVIITDAINHWPAVTKWLDIEYILKIAGERTVPIELGSSYSADDFSQKLMTLREFVNEYYLKEDAVAVGYLAQHDLLNQIPQLREDIRIPEYCGLSRKEEESCDEPEINAWFGPQGTISTLHFDPKDNFLCQVYGCKKIILFSPSDSTFLYPHEGMLSNTSQVDPWNPNLKLFPAFSNATKCQCLLNAGEMLYIPPKWWHHVKALEKSFSVNFWWT